MRKRFKSTSIAIFGLLIIGTLSFSFTTGSERLITRKHIKVMSYNIHYGIGMDKKYDLERIAKVITAQDPDIVGLQEIGDSIMAATLGKLTGMYSIFGPSKENMKGYGDAVLSKYPFKWIGNFSIPSASSSRYQIMGVDVDVSAIYGKETKVRFLNTHFDWTQSIGSQEARIAAVDVIERGFLENNNLPLILTGDLNAVPNSAPLKKLKKKGWVHKEGDVELFTIPVVYPARQIDYVLVRPKKSWNIVNVEVLNEPIASDHFPVLMTLELKQ
jgi:endonuclease/exonuclease/phosphatase family metal-dependent hydrolase